MRRDTIAATRRRSDMRRSVLVAAVLVAMGVPAAPSSASSTEIKVAPKEIAFGTRTVGTDYYDGVKVTNVSGRPLQVLVEAGLPDDFGFGFMPGSTCPVLTPGEVMDDGESCRAVVRFSPTAFFAGWLQMGTLTITATDTTTGSVTRVEVPVSGRGKL